MLKRGIINLAASYIIVDALLGMQQFGSLACPSPLVALTSLARPVHGSFT